MSAKIALRTAPSTPRDEITIHTALAVFRRQGRESLRRRSPTSCNCRTPTRALPSSTLTTVPYASNLGFRRGDIVLSVNGERIAKTRDLERATERPRNSWQIVIRRGGQQISAVFNG